MAQPDANISDIGIKRGQVQCLVPADIASGLATTKAFAPWHHLTTLSLAAILAYTIGLLFYRVYLRPLAAFPGPFLARTTHWYEFYHNFIRTGKYYEKIRDMHDKYGKLS